MDSCVPMKHSVCAAPSGSHLLIVHAIAQIQTLGGRFSLLCVFSHGVFSQTISVSGAKHQIKCATNGSQSSDSTYLLPSS